MSVHCDLEQELCELDTEVKLVDRYPINRDCVQRQVHVQVQAVYKQRYYNCNKTDVLSFNHYFMTCIMCYSCGFVDV